MSLRRGFSNPAALVSRTEATCESRRKAWENSRARASASRGVHLADSRVYFPSTRMWRWSRVQGLQRGDRSIPTARNLNSLRWGLPKLQEAVQNSEAPSARRRRHSFSQAILERRGCSRTSMAPAIKATKRRVLGAVGTKPLAGRVSSRAVSCTRRSNQEAAQPLILQEVYQPLKGPQPLHVEISAISMEGPMPKPFLPKAAATLPDPL